MKKLLSTVAALTLCLAANSQSLEFDGVDDNVSINSPTNIPVGNSPYTLEVWIHPNTMGVKGIIGWGDYGNQDMVNALRLDNTGVYNYWWGDDLYGNTGDITGAWHHIAVTFDGTNRAMYLDGTLISTDAPSGTHAVVTSSNLTIGVTNATEFFDGMIDELRVWNVARTANQIADNMNCSLSSGTGLVASYDFNQGTPNGNNTQTALPDISSTGNDGTLNNFALTGNTSNWSDDVNLPTITPAVSINSSASTVCAGTSVTFSATPTSGGTTPSYQWKKNGTSVGTNSDTYSDNGLSSSDVISCDLTSSISCATGTATSNTISVTVTANPTVSVSGASTSCSGSSVLLTASGATNYTWSANAGSANTATVSVTPSSADTYTVTGEDNGCTATNTITVNVGTTPTVSISGTSAICSGNNTTLTASGATNYTWSANAGSVTTASANVSPSSDDTFTVTGEDNGCTATGTITVNVTATPTVSITGPTSTCAGNTVTLVGNGATTYTWTVGTSSIPTQTLTGVPNSTKTYTLTGANGSCTGTETITVVVNPLPNMNIFGPTSICTGGSTTLNVIGATTYTWSANAGSVNTSSVSLTPSSTDTYTVTGDDGTCTASKTVTVVVNSYPTVSISGSSTVCAGSNEVLTASGATNYTWSANAGSVTTASASISPSSADTYTVTGEDNGCASTSTISVNVTASPTVSVSGTSAICSGTSTTLTASGATTYTWSANAGTAITTSVSVSPAADDTYTVTGEDNNGCTATGTITVNVTATPTLNITGPSSVCAGSSATLTASGAATYTWSANAGSANTATVSVSPTSTDTYTVSSDNSGCMGTETVTVNVNSVPSVTFDINPNTVCSTDPAVTLSGTPSGGSFTGTGVSGSQFDPATAGVGTYTLTYMYSDVNNCSNSDTAVVTVQNCTTGLNSLSSQNVVVYPNPAKNTLHLQNLSAEITSVEIYSNIGQKVMSQFSQFENIDITSLADGIYQVRILKGNAAIGQVKFVKQY
jgi:hypothetical protein